MIRATPRITARLARCLRMWGSARGVAVGAVPSRGNSASALVLVDIALDLVALSPPG
jgi:hypothetical protein